MMDASAFSFLEMSWANLGGCLAQLSRLTESREAYEELRSVNPRNPIAHYALRFLDRLAAGTAEDAEDSPKGVPPRSD